jgi:hypothetical protein
MSVKIDFNRYQENDIIYLSFADPINMDEVAKVFDEAARYASNLPKVAYVILDATQLKTLGLPPNAMQLRTSPLLQQKDKHYVICVGSNSMGQLFGETMTRLTGQTNIKFVKTNDDALALITKLRAQP